MFGMASAKTLHFGFFEIKKVTSTLNGSVLVLLHHTFPTDSLKNTVSFLLNARIVCPSFLWQRRLRGHPKGAISCHIDSTCCKECLRGCFQTCTHTDTSTCYWASRYMRQKFTARPSKTNTCQNMTKEGHSKEVCNKNTNIRTVPTKQENHIWTKSNKILN